MTDRSRDPKSGRPPTPAEQRQQRLEQQLRANLQKRKAQARSRRDSAEDAASDATNARPPLPPASGSD